MEQGAGDPVKCGSSAIGKINDLMTYSIFIYVLAITVDRFSK